MSTAQIFEIKHFAVHDGPGIRTTVFFKGCPLRCTWCHNPEGLSQKTQLAFFESKCTSCGACTEICPQNAQKLTPSRHFLRERCTACGACTDACPTGALQLYGKTVTVDDLLPLLLADREFYEASGGGVTLSGGECLCQADFCAELLKELKKHGIHTAVDTCGAVPRESIEKVLPFTDLFLFDLKAIDEQVHIACTGRSKCDILANLAFLDAQGAGVEIRVPLVPDCNAGEITAIRAHLQTLAHRYPVKVLGYHDLAGSKYRALGMTHALPTRVPSAAEVAQVQQEFDQS